jgi:hypothetical protein
MFNYHTNMRPAMRCLPLLIILITSFSIVIQANAQEMKKDVNQLSKELVNPIGPNWLINTYLNVIKKNGDITNKSSTSTEWLLQPVMPIPLDNKKMGMTLMNRPTLPIILKDPVPKTDSMGGFSGIDNVSGVGDLMIQSAIGSMPRTSFGMYMWGLGVALKFPTASNGKIGSQKYSAGPTGMLIGFTKNYTFGAVATQIWSYAGKSYRENVNQTQFQPTYYMQLGNGWQIGDNPQWTVDWNNNKHEKYDMPVGLGIFKTTYIGGIAWRFGVTPRYYIKNHDSWGNDWGVSFTITPVIKNPYK